jgi:PEP-CTERM motif
MEAVPSRSPLSRAALSNSRWGDVIYYGGADSGHNFNFSSSVLVPGPGTFSGRFDFTDIYFNGPYCPSCPNLTAIGFGIMTLGVIDYPDLPGFLKVDSESFVFVPKVPEPGTLALLLVGVAAVVARRAPPARPFT